MQKFNLFLLLCVGLATSKGIQDEDFFGHGNKWWNIFHPTPAPVPGTCVDGIRNQDERHTDCGGNTCMECGTTYQHAQAALVKIFDADQNLIPTAVRLAFHDCVGPNGCNGCVNMKSNPSNNGLQNIITRFVAERNARFPTISNADFWQLAGITALEIASLKSSHTNSHLRMAFKSGRIDCATTPDETAVNKFPNPTMAGKEMFKWFEQDFGMNDREVTALMGAHSLGKAKRENSGYDGVWIPLRETTFDNEMFITLKEHSGLFTLTQKNPNLFAPQGEDKKFQWEWRDLINLGNSFLHNFMLLNTDVELAFDIDVDSEGHLLEHLGCSRLPFWNQYNANCPPANTKDLVETYADDNGRFLKDFAAVYEKMMTKCNRGITLVPR